MTDADRAHLARAVALAERGRRRTSPNPAVGCVITRDGREIATGVTEPAGGPHAEVVALKTAGPDAAGATAYVTLEPCAHHGRTPPCTDALREAGIARVVYAHPDPNPLAQGGRDALEASGIDTVEDAAMRPWVAAQLEGFLTAVRQHRPHVTLKLAQGWDGRLTTPDRRWLTGASARRAVHRWRACVDGVLVGSGTVLADDPRLDVRHVEAPHGQPRPVVLDARLRTPPDAQVARPGAIIVTTPAAAARAGPLIDRGVQIVEVAPSAGGAGVDLASAMAALADEGLISLLAEPGATLANALVAHHLADRLVLHVAVDLGDGPPAVVGAGSSGPTPALPSPPGHRWSVERSGGAGRDLILHLRPTAANQA